MIDLPLEKKYLIPPVSLMILCTLFELLNLNAYLEFNRTLISHGEYWRIITGNLVHSNWYHLMLNCGGIALIWALHAEHTSVIRYILNTLLLACICGLGLYYYYPENHIYTGLSGLLHGVIIFGALKDIQAGMKTGFLLFLGVWFKVLWEQYNGASADIATLIDARVAIEAHLIGTIAGSFFAIELIYNKFKKVG